MYHQVIYFEQFLLFLASSYGFGKTQTLALRYPNIIFSVQWFSILTMSPFLAFCHFLRTSLLRWVSATKKSFIVHKKSIFWPCLWPTQSFPCRIDSVRRTNFNEMAINAKKEDIVKIENHCTKKIRLGYLPCFSFIFRNELSGHDHF